MNIIENHVDFGHSTKSLFPLGVLIHGVYNRLDTDKRFDPESIVDIFRKYGVTAHYLILRNGEIWELVPPNLQAWHAGKSWFKGITGLNSTFIGIEFIGDNKIDYEEPQYDSGGELIAYLMNQNPAINTGMITTHQIVSGPDIREDYKWDPGPTFDMLKLGMKIQEAT